MISKLAKAEIEKLKSEGLEPTFEDVVVLNSLGCKVENGKDASEFSTLPRRAFLGDYILQEPSLYKRIYIDKVKDLLEDEYYTFMFFMAWVLNVDDSELPKLNNIKNITTAISEFKDKILDFTERQIVTAIQYVCNGNDPFDCDFEDNTNTQKTGVLDIPEKIKSAAHELYCQVISFGLPEGCKDFTIPVVERMIYNALVEKGVDVLKNEQAQATGKFYVYVGKMRTRLMDEKNKETQNG